MDEHKSGMTVDWNDISSTLDRHQAFLEKAKGILRLFHEIVLVKSELPSQNFLLQKIAETTRDVCVAKNRIASFSKNHCKSGKLSKKWISRRDDISNQFTFASSNFSNICALVTKTVNCFE